MINVGTAALMMQKMWEDISFFTKEQAGAVHEAGLLQLDCRKAAEQLAWHGVLSAEEMFDFTAEWYRKFYREEKIITLEQLEKYIQLAEKRDLAWTK